MEYRVLSLWSCFTPLLFVYRNETYNYSCACMQSDAISSSVFVLCLWAVCAGQTFDFWVSRDKGQTTASLPSLASGNSPNPGSWWRKRNVRANQRSPQPQPNSSPSPKSQGIDQGLWQSEPRFNSGESVWKPLHTCDTFSRYSRPLFLIFRSRKSCGSSGPSWLLHSICSNASQKHSSIVRLNSYSWKLGPKHCSNRLWNRKWILKRSFRFVLCVFWGLFWFIRTHNPQMCFFFFAEYLCVCAC